MILTTIDVPLRTDTEGVIRVGKSRVTLRIVINTYKLGNSPETIVNKFLLLTYADTYATIAHYLQHQTELDAYLQDKERVAADVRYR